MSAETWEEKDQKAAKELAYAVSKMTNGGGRRQRKLFIEAMARDHRTLQQAFTQVCVDWLMHLSNLGEFEHDLRNEASVKLAKEVRPILERHPLPFI